MHALQVVVYTSSLVFLKKYFFIFHIFFNLQVVVCTSPLLASLTSASPLLPPSQWGAFMRRLARKIGRRNADHSGGFTSGGFGGGSFGGGSSSFGGGSSFGASDQSFGASSGYGGASVSACTTVYEEECSTSYQQECNTEYENVCNTVFK